MTGLAIRLAGPEDAHTLARLVHEMDEHYDSPIAESVEATARFIAETGLGPAKTIEALLAEQDGEAIGFAAFGKIYPTDEGRLGILLKDLFVSEQARGGGVGRALVTGLAKLCVERGYRRMHWSTPRGNAAAVALYNSLGAEIQADKRYYRFTLEAMSRLSEQG